MRVKMAAVLALGLGWAMAGCGSDEDPTELVGPILDMTVDAKVAAGLPRLVVEDVSFDAGNSPLTLQVVLRFLDPVQSGAYQLFLVSLDGTRSIPAAGSYSTVRADSVRVSRDSLAVTLTVEERGTASSTTGGAINVTHRFVIDEAGLGGDQLDDFGYVVVAVQGSSGSLDPSAPAPLWFKYRDEGVTNLPSRNAWDEGTGSFGRFVAGGDSYVFAAAGQGVGSFFQDRLVVNLSFMPRPPLGYAYRAWMVGASGDADAGPLMSPYPELTNLDSADGATPAAVVQETEIVRAVARTDEAAVGATFHSFSSFIITLELKNGASGRGPASVVGADLPAGILERRDE